MNLTKAERETNILVYKDRLDKIEEELDSMAYQISAVDISVNEGREGFKEAKKEINKLFKEADVLWSVVEYLEKVIKEPENSTLIEFDDEL